MTPPPMDLDTLWTFKPSLFHLFDKLSYYLASVLIVKIDPASRPPIKKMSAVFDLLQSKWRGRVYTIRDT